MAFFATHAYRQSRWTDCVFLVCEPRNGAMHMGTIRDVKAGEELVTHYIDLLQSRKARLKELEELRFFTCLCTRCEEQRADSLWRDPLMMPLDVRVDAQLDAVHCENCGKHSDCAIRLPVNAVSVLSVC